MLGIGIADLILTKTLMPDGSAPAGYASDEYCHNDYARFTRVRGALMISLVGFSLIWTIAVYVLKSASEKLAGVIGWISTFIWVIGILTLFGWKIYGLVLTYNYDGNDCLLTDRAAWLYINLTCWLMFGGSIVIIYSMKFKNKP